MSKHTPGPWGWFGDPKHGGFYLATKHSGRLYVMGFARMGFQHAQPLFRVNELMVDGKELCRFEVAPDVVGVSAAEQAGSGVYRYDITEFDHPDARLIAAAPELLETLKKCVEIMSNGGTWTLEDQRDARAAIAKATGEQQ